MTLEKEIADLKLRNERLVEALEYLQSPPFCDDDPDYGVKTRTYANEAIAGNKENLK